MESTTIKMLNIAFAPLHLLPFRIHVERSVEKNLNPENRKWRSQSSCGLQTVQVRNGPKTIISVPKTLNSTIDNEMKPDSIVFVIDKQLGQYQGAYKVTKNL